MGIFKHCCNFLVLNQFLKQKLDDNVIVRTFCSKFSFFSGNKAGRLPQWYAVVSVCVEISVCILCSRLKQ